MIRAIRAWAGGAWTVLRAPQLIAGVALVTLAVAAPFGAWLATRLQAELANQAPIALGSSEIDPEWWMEYRGRATGLEATFTPSIIGAAAPLDNLSALLDGTHRPLALVLPVALGGLAWAFLWGGLLERFAAGRSLGVRAFCRAGLRRLPQCATIAATAAAAALVLYLSVHAVLFGPIYGWLEAHAASEGIAFAWRIVLYAIFASLLAAVRMLADGARVAMVRGRVRGVGNAFAEGTRLVRANLPAMATLYGMSGLALAAVISGYARIETVGGVRVAGWRGVLIAQAYVVIRIGLRLAMIAAEVRVLGGGPPDDRARAN